MSLEKPDFDSFESTIQALFSRVRGHIEPGSHRMQKLLSSDVFAKLNSIPTILVGGTNGKGTTCALLEKTLRSSGFRTALYTSPHLVEPTERIRLNGKPIDRKTFLRFAERSFFAAQQRLPDATFFELMTSLAFECVAENKPDIFVCEVGLGGRLDSTNVLSPTISVLTSVGLDHTEWLGDTEQKIAFEKSFISRRNRPFIIGSVSDSAREGINKADALIGARLHFANDNANNKTSRISSNALSLCHAVFEQLKTLANIEVSKEQIFAAAQDMHWPGRFDLRRINGTPVILDGAHNSHGVRFFLDEITRRPDLMDAPRPWTIVYASLQDKDWHQCLNLLIPSADNLILTQTRSTRAVSAEEMLNYSSEVKSKIQPLLVSDCPDALDRALKIASHQSGTLFILGSLTLVGEAMEHLNLPVFREFEHGDE